MPNKSKTKGNNFEREVAEYLTKLYKESFTRVPNSGAFVGGKNVVRVENLSQNQIRINKGDIIPPDSFPKLLIECKHYKDFPFHKFAEVMGTIPILDIWLSQIYESWDQKDFWVLWFKINRKGEYILWDTDIFPELYKSDYSFGYHYPLDSKVKPRFAIEKKETFFEMNQNTFKTYSTTGQTIYKG